MHSHAHSSQAKLWLASLATSVGVNVLVIGGVAIWTAQARSSVQDKLAKAVAPAPAPLALLAPVMEAFKPELEEVQPELPPRPKGRAYADTSAAQESPLAPSKAATGGERNTRASSDARPSEGAPDLPSLKGAEPNEMKKPSSFDSSFHDGDESHSGRGDSESSPSVPSAPSPVATNPATAGSAAQQALSGTTAVDRPFRRDPDPQPASAIPLPPEKALEEPPTPKKDDGASTEAEKTKVEGSVAITGPGAMDVVDTPEGRYRSAVKRAVERHWASILAKNSQYLVPGITQVRVFIDPPGKIRTIVFENEMGTSKLQKGLLIGSIRETAMPAMPPEILSQLHGKPFDAPLSFIFTAP
jgi:hypothetical protein